MLHTNDEHFHLHYRYVLECPKCGVIYRSRQFWYGNRDPVENSVRVEIKHVWPGVRLIFITLIEVLYFVFSISLTFYLFLLICQLIFVNRPWCLLACLKPSLVIGK